MAGQPARREGPDPAAVAGLSDLARELDQLRCRAACGSRKTRVSISDLAQHVGLPRSTVHSYVSGGTLPPAEIMDRIVIALGATPAEQAQWSEAWFRVAEHLHVKRQSRDTGPSGSARNVVPRQLPLNVRAFTGRGDELADLDRSLVESADSASLVFAIDGPPGVGKTTLAVHWGHRVRDRFPDGEIYVNLRGYDPDRPAVDPREALSLFLRVLGIDPEQIPQDAEERAGLYRSIIAKKHMLIVLDNAATAGQVRPLLPGTPSCVAVVTSRDRLGGLVAVDGAQHLTLDVLSTADAVTLLENALGQQRIAAEALAAAELAALCGHLPLALRVAAGKLTMRPLQKIASAVDALREGGRLAALQITGDTRAAVGAAFDLSYFALEPGGQRLFRRLGLVPGPDFTAPVAAALTSQPDETAAELLDRLERMHLVEQHTPGRFRLHDLIRLYARDRCDTDESPAQRFDADRQLYDWYLAWTQAAARILYPHLQVLQDHVPEDIDAAFAERTAAWTWMEAERVNLIAAIDQAAARGLPTMAWRLADAMRGFFMVRTYHDDWQTTARTGLSAAEQAGDQRAMAAMHINLGTISWGRGDNHGYLDHSSQALDLAERIGWREAAANARENISLARIILGKPQQALETADQALATWRAIGTPAEVAHNLMVLGYNHGELGNLRQSLEFFEEAAVITRKLNGPGNAIGLYGLGQVLLHLGDLCQAEKCFTEGHAAACEHGTRRGEAHHLSALGEVAANTSRHTEAHDLMRQAIALARDTNRPMTEVWVLNAAGRIANALGDPHAALRHHRRALGMAHELSYRYDETSARIGLAQASLSVGKTENARTLADEALAVTLDVGYRVLAGKALALLAEIELTHGNPDIGVEHARQALRLQRATGHKPGEQRTLHMLSRS